MIKTISIPYEDGEIIIPILRSNRKSITIEINIDLSVTLKVPRYTDDNYIRFFIEKKSKLIIDKYKKAKDNNSLVTRKSYFDLYYNGAKLPLGDKTFILKIINGANNDAIIKQVYNESGQLVLNIETLTKDINFIRECVVSWYKKVAKAKITKIADEQAKIMGVSFQRIIIKEQKTRWGSCSNKNNLNFNWKLILMPDEILRYVVVHELAHLKQMNHSKQFWEEVEQILPDFKSSKEWLKLHGMEYSLY